MWRQEKKQILPNEQFAISSTVIPSCQEDASASSDSKQLVTILDTELKITHCYNRGDIQYKTNLLGEEPNCHKKFKLVPKFGSIYADNAQTEPMLSDVNQGDLGNCEFLVLLRGILRRYPQMISEMIHDIDDRHVGVSLFVNKQGERVHYKLEKTVVVSSGLSGFLYRHNPFDFFLPKAARASEKNWVKFIEKALVLHSMRGEYHCNLMNRQNHELRDLSAGLCDSVHLIL